MGLPDVHSGYGFAIGNMAAFDVNDPQAVVSPGGASKDCKSIYDKHVHVVLYFTSCNLSLITYIQQAG